MENIYYIIWYGTGTEKLYFALHTKRKQEA